MVPSKEFKWVSRSSRTNPNVTISGNGMVVTCRTKCGSERAVVRSHTPIHGKGLQYFEIDFSCSSLRASITVGLSSLKGNMYSLGICSVGEFICQDMKFPCQDAAFGLNDSVGVLIRSSVPHDAEMAAGPVPCSIEASFMINGKHVTLSTPCSVQVPPGVDIFPSVLFRSFSTKTVDFQAKFSDQWLDPT